MAADDESLRALIPPVPPLAVRLPVMPTGDELPELASCLVQAAEAAALGFFHQSRGGGCHAAEEGLAPPVEELAVVVTPRSHGEHSGANVLPLGTARPPGVAVVNIDGGFAAGYYAAMIARQSSNGRNDNTGAS